MTRQFIENLLNKLAKYCPECGSANTAKIPFSKGQRKCLKCGKIFYDGDENDGGDGTVH